MFLRFLVTSIKPNKAKEKQTLLNAKACVDAAQAQLSDLYGRTAVVPDGKPVISGATDCCTDRNEDQVITETDFAKEVLDMADMGGDKKPYFFMIGIGSNAANNAAVGVNMTDHEKYTVYYAAYKETKDSTMEPGQRLIQGLSVPIKILKYLLVTMLSEPVS